MANKDYGQTYYPLGSASPNPASDMEQMAESLEGRTVRSFASTAARDAALATLTEEQKKGVVAHVMGKGLYYYSGSVWRYVSANGENFTQSGTIGVTTQPTGLAIIAYPIPFGGKPVVIASHVQKVYPSDARLVVINDNTNAGNYPSDMNGFHVYITDMAGNPYGNRYTDVTWIAHGPRGVD